MDNLWSDDEYNAYLFGVEEDNESSDAANRQQRPENPPILASLGEESPHASEDEKLSTVQGDETSVKDNNIGEPDKSDEDPLRMPTSTNPPIVEPVGDQVPVRPLEVILLTEAEGEKRKEIQVGEFTECDKVFSYPAARDRHIREIHRRNQSFNCPECQSAFSRKYRVKQHYEAVHGKKYEDFVGGPSEEEPILQASAYKPPMVPQSIHDKVLNMDQLTRTCPECGIHFASRAIKDVHFAKEHTKNNVLKCGKCPMTFATRQDLDEHVHSAHKFTAGSAGAGPSSRPSNVGSSIEKTVPSTEVQVGKAKSFQKQSEPAQVSSPPRDDMPIPPLEVTMQKSDEQAVNSGESEMAVAQSSNAVSVPSEADAVLKRSASAVGETDCQIKVTAKDGPAESTTNPVKDPSDRSAKRQKVTDFKCTKCDKVFSVLAARDRHVHEIHEKSKCFKCPECQRSFSRKYRVKEHYEAVHGKKYEAPDVANTLFCDKCPLKFETKKNLYEHVRLSHGVSSNSATVASAGVETADIGSAGSGSSRGSLKTSFAETTAQAEEGLQGNLNDAQLVRRTCPDCGLVFANAWARDRHRDAVHFKEKPFVCNACKSKFSRKHRLNEHIKAVHERSGPFKCPSCQKEYMHKKILDKHMEKEGHSGDS